MPLSHTIRSQNKNEMTFDLPPFADEFKMKRKLQPEDAFIQTESMEQWKQEQVEDSLRQPKRMCFGQNTESHKIYLPQMEDLPGCLKDTVHATIQNHNHHLAALGQESQTHLSEVNHNIFTMDDLIDHQQQQATTQVPNVNTSEIETSANDGDEMDLAEASMDNDFVPNPQQYASSSSATNTHTKGAYCGCVTCKYVFDTIPQLVRPYYNPFA